MGPVRTTFINANGTIHLLEIGPAGTRRYLCGRSPSGGMILSQSSDPYFTCEPCGRRHAAGENQSAYTTRRRVLANQIMNGFDEAGAILMPAIDYSGVHPRNIPTRIFAHPVGSFVLDSEGDLYRVTGTYDVNGRWLVDANGEEGQARTWDLQYTDDTF